MKSVPSYLTINRCGIYYFQYRVPKHFIQNGSRRRLIRSSLHTRDRRHALKMARKWAVWMDDLAKRFFKHPETFGKAMELLMLYKSQNDNWESVERFLMGLNEDEDQLLDSAIEYDRFTQESREQLKQENETLKRTIEVLHSRISTDSPKHTNLVTEERPSPAPLLSSLVESYIKDISMGWDRKHFDGNDRDLRPRLELIVEIIGDKPCDQITREDVARFKELSIKLPSNRKKKPAYRDLTIDQLSKMEIPEKDLLSVTSANKNLEKASSFFKWSKANSTFVTEELWHPLVRRIKNEVPEDEQRDEFSTEDLNKLFLSTQYVNGTHEKPSHYWIPLIGLFTGARQNEICQLHKSDIYRDEDSGLWVIDINDKTPDKKLKKRSHGRIVPIHPIIINLGFVEFVKQSQGDRVFMELTLKRDGYQDLFSKWFNRTYRSQRYCNVGNRAGEKKNFHSFRHTMINHLEKKGIPQPQVARLVGQLPSDGSVTTRRYGKKNSVEENQKIIETIDFPIDFSQVRKWK